MDLMAGSALFALFAEFMKTRREGADAQDAHAFHAWLQHEAFPALLAKASETFVAVRTLQISERERYDDVVGHLKAIRSMLSGPSIADRWAELDAVCQRILEAFRDHDEPVEIDEIAQRVGAAASETKRSARLLVEKSFLRAHEASGYLGFSPTPTGLRFTWEALDGAGYSQAVRDVHRHLAQLSDHDSVRASELSSKVGLSIDRVDLIVSDWESRDLLELRRYDHGELLIYHVTETLRRMS
jgi:AraC-like DNA-binding protein